METRARTPRFIRLLSSAVLLLAPSAALAEYLSCLEPWREIPRAKASAPGTVDLTDSLPRELSKDAPFNEWLVIPTRDERELQQYTARAADLVFNAVTPAGTFGVRIVPGVRATRVGAKWGVHEGSPRTGVLAQLCFDPAKKGPLEYPHAPAIETARKAGLLTPAQQRTLADTQGHVAQRYPALLREWADFAKAPYLMEQRARLLNTLLGLYHLPGEHLAADLEPHRFFDRAQRIQLRKRGEPIPGQCRVGMPAPPQERLYLELRDCPVSQLVSEWNDRLARFAPGLDAPASRLKATSDGRQYEEVDLSLTLGLPPGGALKAALGLLRSLDGIEDS